MKFDEKDLMIEQIINPGDLGGQHVGITQAKIKITHIPTGITVTSNYGRFQHQNRKIVIEMIRYGLTLLKMK